MKRGKKIRPDQISKSVKDILKKRVKGRVEQVRKAVTIGAMEVRNTAILDIQRGVKSGKTYQLYDPKRIHVASKGGEAPATDTGFLVSQITTNTFVIGASVIGQIVSAAPYSKWLEFGHPARDGSFVEARPFMQPALEQNKKKIKEIFIREGILKR